MNMEERRERLHGETLTLAAAFLDMAKDGKSFVCPVCHHGQGEAKKRGGEKNAGDGITFTPEGRWHCFSCHNKGDIIDLYQLKHGVTHKQAVDELEAMLGFAPHVEPPAPKKPAIADFGELVFSPLTAEWRGLSPATLEKYGVKGCRQFINPKKAGTIKGPRPAVVFPTSEGCYFVRALEHKEGERCDKWDIGGKKPFNLEALKSGRPVFVVEGVIDALSIIEAGGEAVGLSGTDGAGAFLEVLKESPSPNGLLIAADNDGPGKKAAESWKAAFESVGVSCEIVDTAALFAGEKDANDALTKDRDGLRQRVQDLLAKKAEVPNPWRAADLSGLVANIEAGDYEPIPTGIKSIDDLLGGGLYSRQLITLGAEPGKGKTAFCQWLCENMAAKSDEFSALFLCFEMDRGQLQARSISRLLHGQGYKLTALDVMQGKFGWREGVNIYQQEVGEQVAYYGLGSGLHTSSIDEVMRILQDGVRYNASIGRPAPLVVVDYLQLIDVDGKDEQEAIKSVMGQLKDFAVKNNTVVIGIVAHNRESNKSGEPSLYSGRGSSSIEYGADIVLSLAYTDLLAKREEVRDASKISLVVNKGRFCKPKARADFDFQGEYCDFVPCDTFGQAIGRRDSADINSLLAFDPLSR
jgi:replicative DNA helicase